MHQHIQEYRVKRYAALFKSQTKNNCLMCTLPYMYKLFEYVNMRQT